MTKQTYKLKGLDCASCATLLEMDLEEAGIKASCSYATEQLEAEVNPDQENKLKEIIAKSGFTIV